MNRHRRILISLIGLVAFGLAACGSDNGSGGSPPSTGTAASATPSATATTEGSETPIPAGDFCSDVSSFGDIFRSLKKETETADELITALADLQDRVEGHAFALAGEEAEALSDAADAIGRLKVEVARAGNNYPFDPAVRVRTRTAQTAGLTAALELGCGL